MLVDVSLSIPAGQRVLLAGPSGAGKSTLLRAMAGLLLTADHGELSGNVLVDGRDVRTSPGRIGLLQQDPLASVVAETVGRDVAFGLENRQVPREELWRRVVEVLTATDFPYPSTHPTAALSGGETQRLALAGAVVLDNSVLLLDEPTSMLDPAAAELVRAVVRREVASRGTTTVIVEHHLEPWLDFADRLVVLGRDGQLVADGAPREVLSQAGAALAAQGVWVPGLPVPELSLLDLSVLEPQLLSGCSEPAPPAAWIGDLGTTSTRGSPMARSPQGEALVSAQAISVTRQASLTGPRRATQTLALHGVDAELRQGRSLAVTGPSGAGKSTLVAVLAGLQEPTSGVVSSPEHLAPVRRGGRRERRPWRWRSAELAARLAWVPQSPEAGIVASTVYDEMLATSRAVGLDEVPAGRRAEALLEALGLMHLRAASPYHLSGGEQRRLMVAAALVHGPQGILLDEPTVGQDRVTWAAVLGCVSSAQAAGAAVAFATHDDAAVTVVATDQLRLERGGAVR